MRNEGVAFDTAPDNAAAGTSSKGGFSIEGMIEDKIYFTVCLSLYLTHYHKHFILHPASY
jgi:hypothetical protein